MVVPYHALDTETESSRDTERLRSLGSPAPSTHTRTHTHTHTKTLEYNFSCMSSSTIPLTAMPCQDQASHQDCRQCFKFQYFLSTLFQLYINTVHAFNTMQLMSQSYFQGSFTLHGNACARNTHTHTHTFSC